MNFSKPLLRTSAIAGLSGLLLVLCFARVVRGDDFPTKPITVFCGFEPGATVDLLTRAWCNEAQKELKVAVVVENHAGGSGTVAAGLIAKKKPDGYFLGVSPTSQLAIVPLMVPVVFDPLKDFAFLASCLNNMGGICVKSDSPFKTLNDLIEYARKNPEQATYSSPGVGGLLHLAVEQLARQANVKFKHVPYKGGAPASTALLGGHVTFTGGAGIHEKYVKQGLFRMLVSVLSEERNPAFPEVPTLKELGYSDLPPNLNVAYGPRGLPESVAKRLESAFIKAAQSAEFRKFAATIGMTMAIKSRVEIEGGYPEICQSYAKIVKDLGLERKK